MQQQPTPTNPSPNPASLPFLQNSSLITQPMGGGSPPPILLPSEEKKSETLSPAQSVLAQLDDRGGIRIDLSVPASELILGRLLGRGGFGAVYEGVYQGQPVAIKQMSIQLSVDALSELKREAEIMFQLSLSSKRIVKLIKICLEAPYSLVMELMPQGSLYDLLHNGQDLPWTLRYQIAVDAACGLSHLHEHKVLHRDLKSLNILLKNGRAKLADFGLAKVKHESSSQSSVAKGTVLWMAPELFDEKPRMTQASDIYSFGMVLWELVARKLPYARWRPQAAGIRIAQGKKEEIPGDCPRVLKTIIQSCWETNPTRRPTAIQVVERLKPLIVGEEKREQKLPSPASSLDAKALRQLLQYVAEGEQDNAEEMLKGGWFSKGDPQLLLEFGTVTDLSGRTFKSITAFQYALWAMDWHMWTMIKKYLPRDAQVEQLRYLETKGTEHGNHYDIKPLTDALHTYMCDAEGSTYDKNYVQRAYDQWNKGVGGAQKLVPAHVVNEYARPDRPFEPCPTEWELKLPRTREMGVRNSSESKYVRGSWFIAPSYKDTLGSTFAFVRYNHVGRGEQLYGHEMWCGGAYTDTKALKSLWRTRTQQLQALQSELGVVVSQSYPLSVPAPKTALSKAELKLQDELITACERGDAKAVHALLRKGARPDALGTAGWFFTGKHPLGAAVWSMNPAVVRALLHKMSGVSPMTWEECAAHNRQQYEEVVIVPKFDPKNFSEWHALLKKMDPNPFIRESHLKEYDSNSPGRWRLHQEQWDKISGSWEKLCKYMTNKREQEQENCLQKLHFKWYLYINGIVEARRPLYTFNDLKGVISSTEQEYIDFRTQIVKEIQTATIALTRSRIPPNIIPSALVIALSRVERRYKKPIYRILLGGSIGFFGGSLVGKGLGGLQIGAGIGIMVSGDVSPSYLR